MTLLQCGCEQDGSARCPTHMGWLCHQPIGNVIDHDREANPCPPCRIAKWRSVSLSADATPTRKR